MRNGSQWMPRSYVPRTLSGHSVADILTCQLLNLLPCRPQPSLVSDWQLSLRSSSTSSAFKALRQSLRVPVSSANIPTLSNEDGSGIRPSVTPRRPKKSRTLRAKGWNAPTIFKNVQTINKPVCVVSRCKALPLPSGRSPWVRYRSQHTYTPSPTNRPRPRQSMKPQLLYGNYPHKTYGYDPYGGEAFVRVSPKEHSWQPANSTAFIRPVQFCMSWYPAFAKVHASQLPYWSAENVKNSEWRALFRAFRCRLSRKRNRNTNQLSTVDTWTRLSPRQQRQCWMSALLWALHKDPGCAADLLLSMLQMEQCLVPAHIAKDCIAMVIEQLLDTQVAIQQRREEPGPQEVTQCLRLTVKYLQTYARPLGSEPLLSYRSISTFVQHLNGSQLAELFSALSQSGSYLNPRLLRLLSLAFIANGQVHPAMNILSLIPQSQISSAETVRTCTKILQATIEAKLDYKVRTEILTHMLELGVVPDETMRDFIVLNASAAGDRDTAWTSHEIAVNRGLRPSATTYTFLLSTQKGAADLQTISRIHRRASEDGLLPRSPSLASALVHAVANSFLARDHPSRFKYMWVMYKDLFDSGPLQDIGISQKATTKHPRKDRLMRPDERTMALMVSAWISAQDDPHTIKSVYDRWLDRVENGSSRIALTAENNFVVNTFMLRLGQLGNVETCREIMHKLLQTRYVKWSEFDPETSKSGGAAERQHWVLSKPDTTSWNILLKTLLENGHKEAAWEVHSIMKSIRCKPNDATYSAMFSHFTRQQDADGIAQTLMLRQKSGFEDDTWTDQAMKHGMEKSRLLRALADSKSPVRKSMELEKFLEDDVEAADLWHAHDNASLEVLAKRQDRISESHWSYNEHRMANQEWRRKRSVLGSGIAGRKKAHRQ